MQTEAGAGVPYSLIVPTIYGPVIVNRYDINQTNSLIKQGRSLDHDAIDLLFKICLRKNPNPVVLDVGANFGLFTLGLAKLLEGRGVYHCFEAQRVIFNMLAGSVALNGYTNVFCHHVAVGSAAGKVEIPQFDYNRELNFGSVEFADQQHERLTQERGDDASRREFVELRSLDSYDFPQVDILKIDVEGMEDQVLAGAAGLIARRRPVMLVEFLKSDAAALAAQIGAFDYKIYSHGIDLLCIPAELEGALFGG